MAAAQKKRPTASQRKERELRRKTEERLDETHRAIERVRRQKASLQGQLAALDAAEQQLAGRARVFMEDLGLAEPFSVPDDPEPAPAVEDQVAGDEDALTDS